MTKQAAYTKTIRVIESCRDSKALTVAENFLQQYHRMHVKDDAEMYHLNLILTTKQKQLAV